jgi:hypothetical protein
MSEPMSCTYPGDRTEALVAYLYGEDEGGRAAFDAHVAACAACREELDALRGVRTRLSDWAPPEPAGALAWTSPRSGPADVVRGPWRALAAMPAWAQVAAASLIVGVSLGVANVQVQYGSSGVTVRTGWSQPPANPVLRQAQEGPEQGRGAANVANLEKEIADLRSQLETGLAEAKAVPAAAPQAPDALMRQVHALLDERDRRQQRELALRVGEAMRDVDAQRRADLVNIDRSIGTLQNSVGMEMLRQREQLNNYVLRVSSQK